MSEIGRSTLLVTGASGHLGRRVVELLLEAHAGHQLAAATRTPENLADFAARGVSVRKADFNDPESLVRAFDGVDRLLLISTDVMGVPGLRQTQHRKAVQAAEVVGVKHVIYTSLTHPTPDSPVLIAPDHYATEEALAQSRLGWTVLRNNVYAEGLIATLGQAMQSGVLYNAGADGKTAYVSREDCAHAAAAALAASFEGHRTLDISGAEALSGSDLALIGSRISGQHIRYEALPLEVMIQTLVSLGLPQAIAETIVSFDAATARGLFSTVTNNVEELTGRAPIRVEDFLNTQFAVQRQ